MKKIVIYTCAVDGSGDYHAALKVLPLLLKDKNLQITWVVKSQQDAIIKKIPEARQQFPKVNIIHVLPKDPAARNLESTQEIITQLPTDTDLIIVLPNVNEMNFLQSSFLDRCKKAKILNIAEYDYTPTKQPCYTMGLGKDSIGVLIPDLESKLDHIPPKIEEHPGLKGFEKTKPFFFGYSNNTKSSQCKPEQLESFIRSALVIADKEGHDEVQIITNIPLDNIEEIYLEEQVRGIEYHSSTGAIHTLNFCDSAATATLKIFNPFPLSPEEFQSLLHNSHPMTLCTGDQSLIENIFASKCIFYQIMNWKRNLSCAFIDFVKEVCGPNSLYYKFVDTAINDPSFLPIILEKSWDASPDIKHTLQSDARKIANAIRQKKDCSNFLLKLVNLSLSPEEILDRPETLQQIDTSSQLLIVLDAFKNDNSKVLQILQRMQHQLPRIINTFSVFKKIMNMNSMIMIDFPMSSTPVPSLSLVTEEQLSMLITAMLENLPEMTLDTKQFLELFRLPLTPKQRTQVLSALQEKLPILIKSFLDLEDLFNFTKGQLTSEHCTQIFAALKGNLENWMTDFYRLIDLLKLPKEQLTAEHFSQILIALQEKLGTLITSFSQLKDLFKFSNQQLTVEHRTFILSTLRAKLGTLINSSRELKNILSFSNEHLTPQHRSYILNALHSHLGDLITSSYDLSDLLKLSQAQLSSEQRTQILQALQGKLGILLPSFDLYHLFCLPIDNLTVEHRSQILGMLQPNFGMLFKSLSDLTSLFYLSNEQLTLEHRIQILESPAVSSLIKSLNADELQYLNERVADETIRSIITIIQKRQILVASNPLASSETINPNEFIASPLSLEKRSRHRIKGKKGGIKCEPKMDRMEYEFYKIPSRGEAELLSNPELAHLASSSKNLRTLFQPILNVRKLLHYVVRGDHDAVRVLLTQNIDLLFNKGRVMDCSGRTFERISPFEYVLWALDKHMWDTMLSCIPKNKKGNKVLEHLLAQYKGLQTPEDMAEEKVATRQVKGVTYTLNGHTITESHYDFAIIDALEEQVNAQTTPGVTWIAIEKQRREGVGGAQRLVPTHIVDEYCSNTSFVPVPKFNSRPQPENGLRCFYNGLSDNWEPWFERHSQLGVKFSIHKGEGSAWLLPEGEVEEDPQLDLDAMNALYKTRKLDFSVFEAQLESMRIVEVQPQAASCLKRLRSSGLIS